MDKVDMLKECLDKDVQEKIFEKVKSNLGGFDRMSKDDIANMGSMVGQLSFREMKNLDSTTVSTVFKCVDQYATVKATTGGLCHFNIC